MVSIGEITIGSVVAWVIAACAAIATIFKAVEILKSLSKKTQYAERLKQHDEILSSNNRKIAKIEEAIEEQQHAQTVMFRAILSQINHELTGNGDDKLREARDEITKYLTSRP